MLLSQGSITWYWRSSAGKVIAGLALSNGSLTPGNDLKSHLWVDYGVHRDHLQAQRSVKSMGNFTFYLLQFSMAGILVWLAGGVVCLQLAPSHRSGVLTCA